MNKFLEVEKRRAVRSVILGRKSALNALNDAMRSTLMAALPEISRDPEVYAMVIRSNNDRAFCVGGDVRELIALAREDERSAAKSLAFEYLMNWTLECFTKPTVALIDGYVMGSGVGLMLYGTHRVAGANFQFAMPETAIGFFPDVGVCSVLSRLPAHVGYYLALTGHSIRAADALELGLITHCIDAGNFETVESSLADAEPIDPILDKLQRLDPQPGALRKRWRLIDDIFGQESVAGIFEALERAATGDGDDAAWCAATLQDLHARSPISLLVTHRHLNDCRNLSLRDVLVQDYRLACRFLQTPDFHEGVRAVLIDKDDTPNWSHSSIYKVQTKEVDIYFDGLGDAELDLPEREKMQEMR